eukprot:15222108-Ditylum_brightwellii.AAC.2
MEVTLTNGTLEDYIAAQPDHVKQYWIDALKKGLMRITTTQTLLCNNAAAVSRVNMLISPGIKHYIAADFDIVKEIEEVKSSGLDMQANCFKAHQDKKIAVDFLTLDVQLIVHADADVTSFQLHTPPHLWPSPMSIIF